MDYSDGGLNTTETSANWSMDYNDEINSAPNIVIEHGIVDRKTRNLPENLGLKATLGILVVVILALVVMIGLNSRNRLRNSLPIDVYYGYMEANNVSAIYNRVSQDFETGNITIEDGVDSFDDSACGNDDCKIYMGIYCAKLINEYDNNPMRAIDKMELLASLIEGRNFEVRADYYNMLSKLYDSIGDTAMADHYKDLLILNLPSNVIGNAGEGLR